MACHQLCHGLNAAANCRRGYIEYKPHKSMAGIGSVIHQAEQKLFCELQAIVHPTPNRTLPVFAGQAFLLTFQPDRMKCRNQGVEIL